MSHEIPQPASLEDAHEAARQARRHVHAPSVRSVTLRERIGARVDPAFRLHRRWDRIGRLFGDQAMASLDAAHVTVFGLGGVGSFAVEALARSGVGRITLVDFDEVCVTNVNRQLHAMKGTWSRPKAELMKERCDLINPNGRFDAVRSFYQAQTAAELLPVGEGEPDLVIDAIDSVTSKLNLVATCIRRGIPIVSSMGAAGRMDPTLVRTAPLPETHKDALAREIRKNLRRHYGMTDTQLAQVTAVFSPEPRNWPKELAYDNGKGFVCVCPNKENEFFSCDNRNLIEGTAGFVTGTFGMVAASAIVRMITGDLTVPGESPRVPGSATVNDEE